MGVELRPYPDFDTDQLAARFYDLARANREALKARHILGPIKRYGQTLEIAKHNIEKGQQDHRQGVFEHFVVLENNEIVGPASRIHQLRLRRIRGIIPARLALGFLHEDDARANPNIQVWTDFNASEETLEQAHRILIWDTIGQPNRNPSDFIWTIEPINSPRFIHRALMHAGMRGESQGRFDDMENTHWPPPISRLYTVRPGASVIQVS